MTLRNNLKLPIYVPVWYAQYSAVKRLRNEMKWFSQSLVNLHNIMSHPLFPWWDYTAHFSIDNSCYLSDETESVDFFLVPEGSDKMSGSWSVFCAGEGSWTVIGDSLDSLLDLICWQMISINIWVNSTMSCFSWKKTQGYFFFAWYYLNVKLLLFLLLLLLSLLLSRLS